MMTPTTGNAPQDNGNNDTDIFMLSRNRTVLPQGHLYPTTPLRSMGGYCIVRPDGLGLGKYDIGFLTQPH